MFEQAEKFGGEQNDNSWGRVFGYLRKLQFGTMVVQHLKK